MKRIGQLPLAEGTNAFRSYSRIRVSSPFAQRCLHTSPPNLAIVAPIIASGPPPTAPVPSAEHVDSRVARRRKQAELLKKGQDLRAVAAGTGGGSAKHKRFWKDVHVKHTDGMDTPYSQGASHISLWGVC
jgi:ATP synthase F1 complex assembly factor 2